MDWKKLISQRVGHEQLASISTFVSNEVVSTISPIDKYYAESRSILTLISPTLNPQDWLGSAYTVIIVSLTENYFRSILTEILKICLITRKNAADNSINFGSVLWHPNSLVERGAFEHVSFSESKKIADITRKYVGSDLKKLGLEPLLDEYTKVCELRHGIVHSGRYMAGRNALILDFPPSNDAIKICIGYGQLQSIASICTTLVVAYNQAMFEVLCERWATAWRRSPFWALSSENELIKKIWNIFYSKVDADNGLIEERGTWVKCRNLLRAEYNL